MQKYLNRAKQRRFKSFRGPHNLLIVFQRIMSLIRRQPKLKISDKLESVRSAAERLDCSDETIYRMIGKGELRATTEKPIKVNSSDVDAKIRRMYEQAGIAA